MVISIYIVYRAVIVMLSPSRIMDGCDHENMATVIHISPIRLIEGGSAKFIRLASNHQVAIRGSIICKPRASTIVRL